MLRSIASIILGYLLTSLFIAGIGNAVANLLGSGEGSVANPGTWFALDLVIRSLAAITGGYAAARIAGRKELAHALALGLVLTAINIGIIFALPTNHPLWFQIANVLIYLPATHIGGRLRLIKRRVDDATEPESTDI